MNTTAKKQRKVLMPFGIRKKFAAAIAMLLIASLMMVSSTYAWFTLSTAPEVTGITTNVGANGNLEIALLDSRSFASEADDLGIATNIGDSMEVKGALEANVTWGNLVDLSDPSYGLAEMILNPAALNVDAEGKEIKGGLGTLLLAPTYGSDGRVISVQKDTTVGLYQNGRFNEGSYVTAGSGPAGVRIVGVSSGVTLRISTYRTARSSVTMYMTAAKLAAQSSLIDNGQDLANLLMAYVATGENYALTAEDVAALNAVVDDLDDALDAVADAIRKAALTYALSSANTNELSDSDVQAKVTAVESAAITVEALNAATGMNVSSILGTIIAKYTTSRSNLDTASTTVASLTTGSTYATASNALDNLIKKEYMKVSGKTNPTSADVSDIASAAISAGRIEVEMLPGSGIYAEIAEMVGDYTASGLKLTMSYSGMNVTDLPTVMKTSVGGTAMITTAANSAAAGEGSASGGATTIDDPYGYIVDFGFRTNAAGSDLLLDIGGSQRVYADEDNASTQGAGSYLEFAATDPSLFTMTDVEALMSAIRVVFVTPKADTTGYKILGIAAPDIQVTYDNTGARVVTKGASVTEDSEANTVKAQLALWDYTVTELVANKEYQLNLTQIKTNTVDQQQVTATELTPLEQNKAKKVSVLVYLDGDIVDNTFVSNARTSVSGKLNLQFKSSAELQPMDVTSMREASETPVSAEFSALRNAISVVKGTSAYTEAAAAATPTAEQTALLNAVTAAEALTAESTTAEVTAAATALATAAQAAGITLP